MTGKDSKYDVDGGDDGLNGDTSSTSTSTSSEESESPSDSSPDEIPHRIKYDSPKEGRDMVPFALENSDRKRLRDLHSIAEEEFEVRVYKMDVYLAALRSDFNDDKSFLQEMREIGYGFFDQ